MFKGKRISIFCMGMVLVLIMITGCKGSEKDIVSQTKEVEKIIETTSLGTSVSEQEIDKISFSDSFKKNFFSTALLELDSNQIVGIIQNNTMAGEVITIGDFLNQEVENQKNVYQSFLKRQKQSLGLVTKGEKSFSKIYEKDGLAYVYVKIPFTFEKLVIVDREYEVQACTLYRAYLWQKVKNQWQLNDYKQIADFDVSKLEDLFSADIIEGIKQEREKFFTVFGEKKVQFE